MVVCVAEELSFSRAAEKLFVSQPAISKQIQQMERELGVALFKRDRHQVELTPAGTACLPLFQQMKRDYERVQRIARRFDTDVQGSVGIAYPNVTTLSLLSQTLSALREQFPLLHKEDQKSSAPKECNSNEAEVFYTCANQKVTLPKPTLFPLALSNSAMLSPTIFSGSSVSTA